MTLVNAFEVAPVTSTPKTETLIQFVLDETGSMNSCWDATINSFNEYIGSQKTVNDGLTCRVGLTKFSDIGRSFFYASATDNDPKQSQGIRNVFVQKDINDVPLLTRSNYTPNGGTNLYDAIGKTIVDLDGVVKDSQNVLVVIITDGEENASREYNVSAIKTMIADRQAKGWTFIYLGANQDAWKVGSTFGLAKGQTMSYSTAEMSSTMDSLSLATTSYRSARSLNAVDNKSGEVARDFFGGAK
ncbi:von Willebrand factor type A domain protein [compost metagenome]